MFCRFKLKLKPYKIFKANCQTFCLFFFDRKEICYYFWKWLHFLINDSLWKHYNLQLIHRKLNKSIGIFSKSNFGLCHKSNHFFSINENKNKNWHLTIFDFDFILIFITTNFWIIFIQLTTVNYEKILKKCNMEFRKGS